jgi:hypothetical protein
MQQLSAFDILVSSVDLRLHEKKLKSMEIFFAENDGYCTTLVTVTTARLHRYEIIVWVQVKT